MGSVIGFGQRFLRILIIVIFVNRIQVFCTTFPSQNQVIENIKLLSQTDDSGLQPSRLRALLVNDLRNILIKNVRVL